jgi:hypothetical protein
MALIDLKQETMGREATIDPFVQAQELMMIIAQYSDPVRTIQAVCDHPGQIIALQTQITDPQTKQFLPPPCDHTTFEQQIQQLRNDLNKAQMTTRSAETDEDLRGELDDKTWAAGEGSEESRSLRTQLANALSLAARAAPPAPQQLEDRGQKVPDTPDFSGSDSPQLRGWIAQIQIIIRHEPSCFPDNQSNMRYSFNRLSGLALKQVMPHVQDNGEIGLEGLPAFIHLLEAAFGDPD